MQLLSNVLSNTRMCHSICDSDLPGKRDLKEENVCYKVHLELAKMLQKFSKCLKYLLQHIY
jgi:hypothetical protein